MQKKDKGQIERKRKKRSNANCQHNHLETDLHCLLGIKHGHIVTLHKLFFVCQSLDFQNKNAIAFIYNNIPSEFPQVGSGEGKMSAALPLLLKARETSIIIHLPDKNHCGSSDNLLEKDVHLNQSLPGKEIQLRNGHL